MSLSLSKAIYMTKRPTQVVEEPKEEISEEPVSPEPEEISPTPEIDTSDWKSYRNEEYGYEVQYPSTAACSFLDYNPFDPFEAIVKVTHAIKIEFDKESTWTGYFEIYVLENSSRRSLKDWVEKLKTDIAQKGKESCEKERGEGARRRSLAERRMSCDFHRIH